jgi:hypothetical protein
MDLIFLKGVVHLTTHRLTFHASLLDTQPDQVIKAGPAIIHRKPFFMKRRIWLELSHDMICSYNSGSEEDRIRPFRTILCGCDFYLSFVVILNFANLQYLRSRKYVLWMSRTLDCYTSCLIPNPKMSREFWNSQQKKLRLSGEESSKVYISTHFTVTSC